MNPEFPLIVDRARPFSGFFRTLQRVVRPIPPRYDSSEELVRRILREELVLTGRDGNLKTHRSLVSLMNMTGTGKRETIRLLREIGARTSTRFGDNKVWTLRGLNIREIPR
jgi:hypothetical protein